MCVHLQCSVLISLREMNFLSRSERSTLGGVTTVDQERRTRNKAARFAGQVGDHVGDVLGFAVAAEGGRPSLIGCPRSVGRVHVGVDGTWLDDINGDASRAQVARQSTSQIGNGAF